MKIIEVRLEQLQADPNQPRKEFPGHEIEELSQSLIQLRQLVPILVVAISSELWMVVDGERRLRAARLAGLETLQAIVLEKTPDRAELAVWSLAANCHRQDLSPIEMMLAYKSLMSAKGLNASELAKLVNKSKATVTRILSLDRLSDHEKSLVAEGKLGSAGAYALTRMDDATRRELALTDAAIPTKRDLEQQAKQGARVNALKPHHLRCELADCSIAIRTERSFTPDDLIGALNSLIKACKQAKAQQLDLSTLTRVLRDQASAARRNQEGSVT